MTSFTAAERAVVEKSFSNISSIIFRKAPSEDSTDLFQGLSTEVLERILLCLNPRELLDAICDEDFHDVLVGSAKLQDVLGTRLGGHPLDIDRANVPRAQLLPPGYSCTRFSERLLHPIRARRLRLDHRFTRSPLCQSVQRDGHEYLRDGLLR